MKCKVGAIIQLCKAGGRAGVPLFGELMLHFLHVLPVVRLQTAALKEMFKMQSAINEGTDTFFVFTFETRVLTGSYCLAFLLDYAGSDEHVQRIIHSSLYVLLVFLQWKLRGGEISINNL